MCSIESGMGLSRWTRKRISRMLSMLKNCARRRNEDSRARCETGNWNIACVGDCHCYCSNTGTEWTRISQVIESLLRAERRAGFEIMGKGIALQRGRTSACEFYSSEEHIHSVYVGAFLTDG